MAQKSFLWLLAILGFILGFMGTALLFLCLLALNDLSAPDASWRLFIQYSLGLLLLVLSLVDWGTFLWLGQRFNFWTVMNPFKTSLCPYCFEHIYVGDGAVVSAFDKKVIDPAPRGFQRFLYRFLLPTLLGPRYAKEDAARKCPNTLCTGVLPYNLEYMDNQFIALVGGQSSGKSVYIASLIKQLEKDKIRERIGCTEFSPLTKDVADRYNDAYYRPLFVERKILPATRAVGPVDPLIYTMVFEKKRSFKSVNLVLFDGAGEGIEDAAMVARVYRYIMNASAIIFMVDPMAFPAFVAQLPPHLRAKKAVGMDPSKVLDLIKGRIRREKSIRVGSEELNIPIAITLSKSDLCRYVILDPKSPPRFLQTPSYSKGFDLQDAQAVNDEVEDLIERLDGVAILQSSQVFKTKAYFAVSATGCSAQKQGEDEVFPVVEPRRCVDPLLWALWHLGVTDPRQA